MSIAYDTVRSSVIEMGEYQAETIDALFARVDVTWPKNAHARFVVSHPGELTLIRSSHSAINSSSRRLQRHMNEADSRYYFACLPLNGGIRIKHLGRECSVNRGQLGVLTVDEEYEIEMSDQLEAIWLRIPGEILRSYAMSVNEVLWQPLDASKGMGLAVQHLAGGALNECHEVSTRGARLMAQSLVSFVGEMVNSAAHGNAVGLSLHRKKILARACEFIEAHLDDEDLSPQSIAGGIGISARYLSDIFSAEGISPMRWVQKRRLEVCRKELELNLKAGSQLICEIAYAAGFTNVSSFNRAFKAQFGRSPSEYMGTKSQS